MQRLSEDHGVATVLRALLFVELRLGEHREAAPIAEELAHRRSELRAAQEAFDEAHVRRLAATAEVSYRDDVVDAAVMNLAEETLRLVKQNRADERYRKLFPVAPDEAVSATASNRQHRFVHQLIDVLRTTVELSPLRVHAELIAERQAALEAVLAERESAFQEETRALRHRNQALDEACRSYNRSPARLQLLFRDGARIHSFYPNLFTPRGIDAP